MNDEKVITSAEELVSRNNLVESLDRILKEVQKGGERMREQERLGDVADQWRMVIAIFDRLLFVAVLIAILSITIWFLIGL